MSLKEAEAQVPWPLQLWVTGVCVIAHGVRAEALLRQGQKDFERVSLELWQLDSSQNGLLSQCGCGEAQAGHTSCLRNSEIL